MVLRLFLFLSFTFFSYDVTTINLSPGDPASYSRPDLAIINHIGLVWDVDFERQVLDGSARIEWNVLQDIDELILDVSSLNIESIESERGNNLDFRITDFVPRYGAKLTVTLDQRARAGEQILIDIKYSTSPNATALVWLQPNQTSSNTLPYVFSICVPINARSIVPCQDTPSVKFTFDARVSAPANSTILMGALHVRTAGNTSFFNQPVPIPSYLLALTVGDLVYRDIGPRTRVWAEASEIEASAREFAATEQYLQAAEHYCGPYDWTRYDLLVQPMYFPFSGMENPTMTFMAMFLLFDTRTISETLVHEIVHSWAGNMISLKHFGHFWMKETFTVFIERKIQGYLIEDPEEGRLVRDFHSIMGMRQLQSAIEAMNSTSPLTRMVIDISRDHPDGAINLVGYEKGPLLLRIIEDLVGGPDVFDAYLTSYITTFRTQSIDTSQFLEHLLEYFKDYEQINEIDWETWLYGTGMPPVLPQFHPSLTVTISQLADSLVNETFVPTAADVESFSTHQLILLLEELLDRPPLALARLDVIGAAYGLDSSDNLDITSRWMRLRIRSEDLGSLDTVFRFLNQNINVKYLRPLYRDLYAWKAVRRQAQENFLRNKSQMKYPLAAASQLSTELHLEEYF